MTINPDTIGPEVLAFLIAFFAALLTGPRVIDALRVLKFGQNINTNAPETHQKKQGTPTMGGVLIVGSVLIALALLQQMSGPLLAVLFVFVAHALLGFTDDYRKAKRGKSLGLKAREKLAGQVVIAIAFALYLALTATPGLTTALTLWHGVTVNLGYGYYLLAIFLMIGLSNATNLTDGVDGLAGGTAIFASLGLTFTVFTAHAGFAYLPWFGAALAGGCLGFLWYNAHPAKVFMGDTGSLALGSSLTAMALLGKQEVLLLLFSLVFVMETLSVMLQVAVFQITKRQTGTGRRLFKMTPIHHHFELLGWAETQVTARFCILGALALAVGLWLAPALSAWVGK